MKTYLFQIRAFLIFLALVLTYELLVLPQLLPMLYPYFDNLELQIWSYKKQQIEKTDIQPDVLIIGDSKALGAIDPLILKKATGKNSLNLALPAIDPSAQFYLLEKYLANNPEPQEIYFLPSPELLTENLWTEYFYNKRTISWFLSKSEALSVILESFPQENIGNPLGQLFLRTFLPSALFRTDFQKLNRNYQQNNIAKIVDKNKRIQQQLQTEHGYKAWAELGYLMGKPSKEYTKFVLDNPQAKHTHWYKIYDLLYVFNPVERKVNYLKSTLAVLNELPETKVYFLQTPEPFSLYQEREVINFHKHVEKIHQEFEAEFTNIDFVNIGLPAIPDSYFEDLMHLNQKGSVFFTSELIRKLK